MGLGFKEPDNNPKDPKISPEAFLAATSSNVIGQIRKS